MALGIYWASGLLCVFILVLALDIMGIFGGKNRFLVDGKVVLTRYSLATS